MFDPSKSSTYKIIPCSSPKCKRVENTNCSSDGKGKCEYYNYNLYVDTTYLRGDLSVDTLTLNSNNGSPISFPNTVIGCGHRNKWTLEGYASGIIGLGPKSLSFTSQLGSLFEINKIHICSIMIYFFNSFVIDDIDLQTSLFEFYFDTNLLRS
jgi:hypothetical protein